MGDDAVTTLALSGADHTGKTKQLGILTRRIGPAAASSGPLDAHDVRWEAIKKNDMSRWWFETGPMQEVAEVLAASYLQRSHHLGATMELGPYPRPGPLGRAPMSCGSQRPERRGSDLLPCTSRRSHEHHRSQHLRSPCRRRPPPCGRDGASGGSYRRRR